MEDLLKQLIENVNEIKNNLASVDQSIQGLEQRLLRLEKMDSIEHRVSVNQIDLTDIKEIVEKVEQFQHDIILPMTKRQNSEELAYIHKRLDAQLTKIAQNEEAILMMSGKIEKSN